MNVNLVKSQVKQAIQDMKVTPEHIEKVAIVAKKTGNLDFRVLYTHARYTLAEQERSKGVEN